MGKLTDQHGNRMCSVCSQNRTVTKDVPYCLECQAKSVGITNCLQALKKKNLELQEIHYFLYSKGIEVPEIMTSINILTQAEKKIMNSTFYKVEQSSIYGIALNI